MLREKAIPPAKVYTASAHREPNLYEMVGDRCREVAADEGAQTRLVVAVFQKLFRRPVFLRELREAGFLGAVDAPSAAREEREESRRALMKLGLQIPTNEPAYRLEERRNELRDLILCDVIVERFGLTPLVVDTKQTKLMER